MSETKRIGDYVLLQKIGEGASGEVFKACNANTKQVVALKIFHAHYAMDEVSMQRFVQEARICMQFDHPRIIKVFDFAIYYNRPMIVMEYVSGISLAKYIEERQRLSVSKALKIGLYVAQGIHYAHQRGVVHRDLNPSNILLAKKAQLKIVDFGIVKVYANAITMGCQSLGTLNYIPLEQLDNARGVDHRADIYGLGATLYHAILGKPPFADLQGIYALTLRMSATPVTPLKNLMEISPSVSALLDKALAQDKAKRFQSMEEFFHAIHKELKKMSTPAKDR